jgi:hypothetical protein
MDFSGGRGGGGGGGGAHAPDPAMIMDQARRRSFICCGVRLRDCVQPAQRSARGPAGALR